MSEEVDNAPAAEATTEAPTTETPVNFYDSWDDDLKSNPSLSKFTDEQSIFRSYNELQKMVGYKGDIPAVDADEADWNAFYGKLGRPETKDGYEFAIPEGLNQTDGYDSYLDKVKDTAIKYNMTKKQAEGFVSEMMGYEAELASNQREVSAQKEQEGVDLLNNEWGESKADMIAGVRALMGAKGLSPEIAEAMEANPQTMLLLGKIAKDLDEKGQAGETYLSTRAGFEDQLGEVNSEIQTIMQETGNRNDRRLDPLLAKRERLMDKMS